MKPGVLQTDIHALIESKSFATLKSAIADMEIHDLAELLSELEGEDLALVFRLLPQARAAEVFGDLDLEEQEQLLHFLSSEKVATILNEMPPDERTYLLEELPGELAQRLLEALRGDELQVARNLLAYPPDSVGRLMTPEYVAVRPDWTVEQVFAHIRKVGAAKETLNMIYVVDEHHKLIDDIRLEQFVLAEPDSHVQELMDNQFAALVTVEDEESAVEIFRKYDAVALPVINKQGVLVGIVTVDDVLDVVEEETTEDFHKMSAVAVLEDSYFDTPYGKMLRKRLPWLALLLAGETLTVVAITNFERSIDVVYMALLAVFIPFINSPAGNAGSQVAGLMIRGLAVQEISLGRWKQVLMRELMVGITLGAALGVISFPVVMLFGRPLYVAMAVSSAICLGVLFANVVGAMMPFFFKRIGLDPAVTSGPFIASLMDVSCVIIYLSIALLVLGIFG